MAERVARAIFCADCDFGYSIRLTSLVDDLSEYTLTYSDGSEPLKFDCYQGASEHTEARRNEVRARAVIEAMREPTEEMVAAAWIARAALQPGTLPGAVFGAAYTAMIDAALHDGAPA